MSTTFVNPPNCPLALVMNNILTQMAPLCMGHTTYEDDIIVLLILMSTVFFLNIHYFRKFL